MHLDEFAVMGDAIQHYGPEAQQIKAVEEMSELTKELCKRLAGAENVLQIAEEIADVRIMLDQLEMMLCCTGRVKTYRAAKLRRLEQRIREDCVDQAAWAACDPEEAGVLPHLPSVRTGVSSPAGGGTEEAGA